MTENKEKTGMTEDLLDEDEEDTQRDKYLTFAVGREDYGIAICHVTEIIGIQKITEVPDMPEHVKGVINLRGKVIPVMDVRLRFRMEQRDYDDRTCIVVVDVNNAAIGLVVDTVKEVADIPANQIEPPPDVSDGNRQLFIQGLGKVGDEVKILLDVGKLVRKDEMPSIPALAALHQQPGQAQAMAL